MLRVYTVEDDESIREIIMYALQSAGFEATGFESGEEFFAAAENFPPNLVLLDIMLPGEGGLTILKKLRLYPRTVSTPVIMLTAKGAELDKVKALDMGADDYISKPFGVMELISRVNAVLRRSSPESQPDSVIKLGVLIIDNARREVYVNGERVELTFKEYELLHYLVQNTDLAMSREKIMSAVWGFDFEGESRTLDMHIRTLRKKIGVAKAYIKTVRNIGYKVGE